MEYVRQSLNAGEEIVYAAHFHWMYTLHAVLSIIWGALGCAFVIFAAVYVQNYFGRALGAEGGWLGEVRALHPIIRLGAFLVLILGLLRFAQMMVIRSSTEIAVTNSRIIYKRGVVARYVGELNIDRIEGVNVLQTVFGRMFDYGRIMVRGMGVGEVVLPPIADPIGFRKAIERARTV